MAKIFVVDDSETLRAQLRRDLQGAAHDVVEAHDGVHALETLEMNPGVELVICDVNMPRMDGFAFCERLRAKADFKATPIFMLTTETSPEMKQKGKSIGVTAWIIKPYVAEKLVDAIQKVLSGAGKKKAA